MAWEKEKATKKKNSTDQEERDGNSERGSQKAGGGQWGGKGIAKRSKIIISNVDRAGWRQKPSNNKIAAGGRRRG